MSLKLKIGLAVGTLILLVLVAAFVFQTQIGQWMFQRGVAQRTVTDTISTLDDGLHLGLCGTGSPMPNLDRAGPCNVIVAGDQMFVVDIGEGGAETLNVMGINDGKLDAALLTHFHSDHIDGMGPLMLYHWTRGASTAPLPVYGPAGVEAVMAGFNAAYATDSTYRIAHHGEEVVPTSGGGGEARAFEVPAQQAVVFERKGLTITAFAVDHDPIKPAVGYRFDYKGRSLCISGDTANSLNLERACKDVDLLVHDALQPALLNEMKDALEADGQTGAAQIMFDIQDYHATPEQAADSAQAAGAGMLVLSHLVPPMPSAYLYPVFLGDAERRFDGAVVVGEDGMFFSLPAENDTIERLRLM